jgi:hypothetical protein
MHFLEGKKSKADILLKLVTPAQNISKKQISAAEFIFRGKVQIPGNIRTPQRGKQNPESFT